MRERTRLAQSRDGSAVEEARKPSVLLLEIAGRVTVPGCRMAQRVASLGRLRTIGLVEYPAPGMVRALESLFLD